MVDLPELPELPESKECELELEWKALLERDSPYRDGPSSPEDIAPIWFSILYEAYGGNPDLLPAIAQKVLADVASIVQEDEREAYKAEYEPRVMKPLLEYWVDIKTRQARNDIEQHAAAARYLKSIAPSKPKGAAAVRTTEEPSNQNRRLSASINNKIAAQKMTEYLTTTGIKVIVFAKNAGTSDSTIRKVRRTGKCRRETWEGIARAMDTTLEKLLDLDQKKSTE